MAATISAIAAPTAGAAKTGSIFDMTIARGYERVTFTGDSAAKCEDFGTCGYKGTVTYAIDGKPRGTLLLAKSRSGRYTGGATYKTKGVTTADVTMPDGTACTDIVKHGTDVFSMTSLPASAKTLLLSYHDAGDDYLDTTCTTPTEENLQAAGALPEGTFEAAGFTGKRVKWALKGALEFKANGFSGASEWKLGFKASGRRCNPRCRIPAQRPR